MCKKLLCLLVYVCIILSTNNAKAQTQFWSDTFEDAGAPSSGTRVPESQGGSGDNYFLRTNGSGINVNTPYSLMEGTKFWAGEGHAGYSQAELQIEFQGINATGLTNLEFRGLFAANNGAAWENALVGAPSTDYMTVEYSFNAGSTWTTLLDFRGNDNTNKQLCLDTNGDGIGDGAPLTYAFSERTKTIAATGTTMILRIRVSANGIGEEWAIDNFRLYNTAACTAPVITGNPPNRTVCAGNNTTFPSTATGATAYQWQVNTGSGFTDISNGGVYSNATTNSLTITGTTGGMSGYTYRCKAINGVTTCFTNTNQAALTVISVTSTGSQTDITCYGANSGIASVTPAGGIFPYTYTWSPSGGSSATASGLAAGDYTVSIMDNLGCQATRSYTIIQPASAPGANSYQLPMANQTVVKTIGVNFTSGSCELVSSVFPSGGTPVSGSVTNKVWIESSVPVVGVTPYVQRHYEITPSTNPSSVTGTVTLYYTQTEFDNFNAHAGSILNLPTGPSDNAGKANLRIAKYSGTSGDGSGLPGSYSSSVIVIDPDDAKIVWNAVSNAWEVTIDVNGFSGFIAQTSATVLPVTWASFIVRQQDKNMLLNWSTSTEQHTKDFTVQHKNETGTWATISRLPAAGNSSSLVKYSYIHPSPSIGLNLYRIVQADLDGKESFSETRSVRFEKVQSSFTILANPVVNGVLQVQVNKPVHLSLLNSEGKLIWKKQATTGLLSVPIGNRLKGIYTLRSEHESRKIIIQ